MEKRLKITLMAARKNKNLTQTDVARKLGVSMQTLCNWERGYTIPNIMQFQQLCDIYEVTADDILLPEKRVEEVHTERA